MSIARHHAEWLSLMEISGPFLSMPVLMAAFPQGLDAHDREHAPLLRAAYEEWVDNQGGLTPEMAIHRAWLRFVLTQTLAWPADLLAEGQAIPEGIKAVLAEHGETIRPDMMLVEPDTGRPCLLIHTYPPTQDLHQVVPGRNWKASPALRLLALLHSTDIRLGLATNGEEWLLVQAKRGETTGYVSWYAGLWLEEPLTLRAFQSLLGVSRFFGVPEGQTLPALLDASAKDQHEVTDQLGYQVRRAVEILVQAIDRADQDRGRMLLVGVNEAQLYEAALTVMMRLVFLLTAEERGLLLLGDPLYDQSYAVSTLRAQLRAQADQHGEEVLERGFDAWCRLLATCRAVHGGVQHENLNLPAYGGSLFDPDRFPFLEGRGSAADNALSAADPLPINNRTTLHLLEALQLLQVRVAGGAEARRLSFRALDIEQIGHVYEGLLDHEARRATEPVLGLAGTKNKEPEVALARLEGLAGSSEQLAVSSGQLVVEEGRLEKLLDFLQEETGRSRAALKNALPTDNRSPNRSPITDNRLRIACGNDETLYRRVLPFAGLVRDDDYGWPVVVPAGSVYVTAGATRRATGTHYTPRSLTEPIVQHTLEPLVYVGPAEGHPREQWQLRSPRELLELKVCDMAMGSGAFLVQACRYLSERLVEAWGEASEQLAVSSEQSHSLATAHRSLPTAHLQITPEGQPATGDPGETIIPEDDEERLALARRLVADRCLYGVDKNHLAVEMAKLSLWLITLDKNRPFTFLNHALKHGDSLIGADEQMFLRWSETLKGTVGPLYYEENEKALALARQKRQALQAFTVRDVRDAAEKARLLAEAEAAMARIKRGCDLLVGVRLLADLNESEKETWLAELLIEHTAKEDLTSEKAQRALKAAQALPAFHWPFEFPEVFAEGGFSAFVGNPPFMGGRLIGNTFGNFYRDFLEAYKNGRKGSADFCVYFLLNAFRSMQNEGVMGFITTNSIADTDTRVVGLEQIVLMGGKIILATKDASWPGAASVVVSLLHIKKGNWNNKRLFNSEATNYISSRLDTIPTETTPYPLIKMTETNSQGMSIMGEGFVLEQTEKDTLIAADPRNIEIIFGYFNGGDLNNLVSISQPRRWIINFGDLPEEQAKTYLLPWKRVTELVKPYRDGLTGQIHEDCFWKYWDRRPRLQEAIKKGNKLLACAVVTKYVLFQFVPTSQVYNHKVKLLFYYSWWEFAVLQSHFHTEWATWRSGNLGSTTLNYSTSESLDTFPMPDNDNQLMARMEVVGKEYDEVRDQIRERLQAGLTDTYNRFHNPEETALDIAHLRQLHMEMDNAVAAAYGWQDLDLGHGFHETAQGLRYTISEAARREVLTRLLRLNHERHAEEVKLGLHEKKSTLKGKGAKGTRKKGTKNDGQMSLL